MRVIGIDSATSFPSVALIDDDQLLAQRIYREDTSNGLPAGRAHKSHSEILLPLIDAVLSDAGVALKDIDGVAVSIGPGSFTGVRIGLSTAKGLVYGGAAALVGVSTLHAYASGFDSCDLVCPLLDARKKEVYMAIFKRENGKQIRITEDFVAPIESAIKKIATHTVTATCSLIGEGSRVYRKDFESVLGARVRVIDGEDPCVAAMVARLGRAQIVAAGGDDLALLAPAYLRRAEAEVKRDMANLQSG